MRLGHAISAALLLFIATLAAPVAADTLNFPPLTGRVVDAANILTPDATSALADKLKTIETSTGHQLVIATIPDLQGRDIADYGYQLGRNWGVGSKVSNDGAIIIVAPNDRKVRIEVGYGLEPIVTDALSSAIITTEITPAFKVGDYAGGLNKAVDTLGDLLKLPPDQAQARAKQLADQAAQQQQQVRSARGWAHAIPWIIFLFFFFIMPMLTGGRRGGLGLWPLMFMGGGFGGGYRGDSDSFGGGGGFSGGGGSFGGGGASGGW